MQIVSQEIRGNLKGYSKTHPVKAVPKVILPKDVKSKEDFRKLLSQCLGSSNNESRDDSSKRSRKRIIVSSQEKQIDELYEFIKQNKMRFTDSIYSTGGSGRTKNPLYKTNYWAMQLDKFIVLEAIGQKNNATYVVVVDDKHKTEDLLIEVGRQGAVSDMGLPIYKVTHDSYSDENGNDIEYSTEHIMKLLECIKEHPNETNKALRKRKRERVMNLSSKSLKKRNKYDEKGKKYEISSRTKRKGNSILTSLKYGGTYSSLTTLLAEVDRSVQDKGTDDIISTVRSAIRATDISKSEIINAGSEIISKDDKNKEGVGDEAK